MGLTGTEFESLVQPFFKTIFGKMGFHVIEVRNQASGTQNGFDIKIVFTDEAGNKRNLFIECKYYTSKLNWAEIFRKQLELHSSNYNVDGFILLSPMVNLSNIDDNLQSKIKKSWFGFPADFWTPDMGVESLFALDSDLFEKVYDKKCTLTIDETTELTRIKVLIEHLLKEKDTPSKPLPAKKQFPTPAGYIARRIIPFGESDLQLFQRQGKNTSEILKKENRVALLGWAGAGKSVELERLAYEISAKGSPYYPFLIKLNIHTDQSIVERIPEVKEIPANAMLVLLDGLDEVQMGKFEAMRRKILDFATDFPEAKIIVSCRSNFYTTVLENGQLNTLTGFKSYQLANLSYADIESYVGKKMPLKKDGFFKEVADKNLNSLLQVPYYLIKLTDQYATGNKISNSKAELFEEVILENIKKDVKRHFPDDRDSKELEMRRALEKLAFIFEYQGKNNGTWKEIQQTLSKNEQYIIKCAGSLLDGSEGGDSTWKFSHNNIQEYLVAKLLSKQKFEVIKKVICFPKAYKKVKPTWVNTLSFIISSLSESNEVRQQLLDWLSDNEQELLIKFEPDKLTDSIRYQVFEKIFNFYKKEKRRVNRSKFNPYELAKFSRSEKSLNFLIQELQNDRPIASRANALDLISFYEIESNYPYRVVESKLVIEQILFKESELQYLSLKAYVELFQLKEDEFEKLMKRFQNSSDTWIRYILFYSIHKQGYQDKYIETVLGFTRKYISKELEESERLSNEYSELENCIRAVKSLDATKKVVDFIMNDYRRISHAIYFGKTIDYTLEHVSKSFPNDNDLYEKIKSAFDSQNIGIYDERVKEIIKYFDATGNKSRVFRELYASNVADLRYYTLNQLALLANEDGIEFFANEFKASRISIDTVNSFQYCLKRNGRYLKQFNKLVNEKESIRLPVYRDMEKEKYEMRERTKALLFDKDTFKVAIEQVFIDAGKDVLTYDEIWEIQKTEFEGKYLPVVYETTRLYENHQKREKTKLLDWIENNWEGYSIRKIIGFLKDDSDPEFTNDQLNYIKTWCDKKAQEVNFKAALSQSNARTTTANREAVKLSFLVRRLKLDHYETDFYLNMLSFQKWDDKEVNIIDFVESVAPKDKIDERVIKNLSEGIEFEMVLENHLDYCVKHGLTQASEHLIMYLEDGGYQRYKVLESYNALGGSLEKLENILPNITDDFKFQLIRELINRKSRNVLNYVRRSFDSSENESEKLWLASYLMELQDIKGVKFYLDYINQKKVVPDDSALANPLNKLTTVKALSYIFQLYEMSYNKSINQDRFNNLKDIAVGAIQAICLFNDNFPACRNKFRMYKLKFKVKSFFNISNLPEEVILNMNHYFENIENQYYVNKSVNIDLDEALLKYATVK